MFPDIPIIQAYILYDRQTHKHKSTISSSF